MKVGCSKPDSHRHCTGFEPVASPVGLLERGRGKGIGPGGRSCTRTGSVLSGVSLLLDYAGRKMTWRLIGFQHSTGTRSASG